MPDVAASRQRAVSQRLQAHKRAPDYYEVYNPSSGSAYDVRRSPGGTWYCTCPFATKGNHLRSGNNCKHLQRVLDKENGCGQALCRADKPCASCTFDNQMQTRTIKT